MKRLTILFFMVMLIFMLTGCGSGNGGSQSGMGENPEESGESQYGESEESQYGEALDVLSAIRQSYKEEDMFAIYGGNQENAVMDAPGKFDISKTEEMKVNLGLPEELWDDIDDAASMVHMMNVNIFTGAVYHLKDGTDSNDFADAVKTNIMATQWICGQPDTLVVIEVKGNYIITAYGEAEIMETFKNNALSALDGSQVVIEEPIS